MYYGFQPYETSEHICVVIGGPLLYFSDVSFISDKSDRNSGTKAIYKRWLTGEMKWDDDLSGPFAICIINKNNADAFFVTDLMSFIPLYQFIDSENVMVSSHSDALARSANQMNRIDLVSKIDFILHGVITYPYTVYKNVKQLAPASEHILISSNEKLVQKSYWQPEEETYTKSIDQAADDLRQAVTTDVNKIIKETENIAQFLSGGEDSRTISGLLTGIPNRDAFIFLDQMNREGKVADKAAKAYEAKLHLFTRDQLHYLNIIPNCADLVGEGAQYFHAHTFGFHKKCQLNNYDAVFGGLFSDALLKEPV